VLNAVFRGFHTVKGGAGFLNISALVEVCHLAEDVFNLLRQGQLLVDAALMDTVLKVTDVVKAMMELVRTGKEPEQADPELLQMLRVLAKPQQEETSDYGVVAATNHGVISRHSHDENAGKDAVERKFEELLGMPDMAAPDHTITDDRSAPKQKGGGAESENITDEEFEALLDKLHGTSAPGGSRQTHGDNPQIATRVESPVKNISKSVKASDGAPFVQGADTAIKADSVKLFDSRTMKAKTDAVGGDNVVDAKKSGVTKETIAQSQADTTVRVDTKRLDDIMNLVGELVLVRNRLDTLKLSMGNEEVAQAVSNLVVVTSDLQAAVMKTRMQPIKKVFGRFPRVVRDLSRSLNKEINLELIGEETDLDKNLVEALADPLVHLVRNSIDHGIEMPDARESSGKPRAGTITLSAKQEGDHILLVIKDDGAGMSSDGLRRKAVEKGVLDADTAARLDERECYNLIFMPGFSTKSEISDISGRGVGMDVVKTRITQLNGNVEIDSKEGVGTEIIIKLPLTLAIVPTLMVLVGNQIFAIPLANVSEIIQYDLLRKNVVDGQTVAIVRDHPLPLFYLRNWLLRDYGDMGPVNESSYVVVIKIGPTRIACVVDHLIAQEEVVIKPLGALLHGLPGLAGATITGDGRIAIILDMPGLISRYARRLN
jgi:two-component system chemotaxis sensor kinase CheA